MPVQKLNKTSIHYVEQGHGLPLVLLHGFPLDSRIFAAQAHDLSRICRVIAPDLTGFGKSAATGPFRMRSLADDVFELLTQIKALPCVLGGISMGGYVALAYQEAYANTLRGLILIDTQAEADTAEGKAARNSAIELAKTGSSAIAAQMLPKLVAPDADSKVKEELKAIMENCPALTMQHALEAMRDRDDFSLRLGAIAAPTLILVGEQDTITPPSFSQTMHERIKGSKLAIIAKAGHTTPMEQPKEVNHAIEHFLREFNRRG